ncbi:hypothetical protein AN958_06745 [Leucoagaricus sp. SymC.cos]|nr:hypothetical protein AN958_06745 [Leucoagaricus sp. SymC.cos]
MPPKGGIVKSGNAGNSSKSSNSAGPKTDAEKPLFPLGFKYPLSLLHEQCRKEGWEKPIVDTIHRGEKGYSFIVTLARLNKRSSERETVRLSPLQPYYRPSALEARHWGATYALYRFCNAIQLNRVLPPGPRDYWHELADEHKSTPEHHNWMYAADPFKERQAKAALRRESSIEISEKRQQLPVSLSGPFKDNLEVKMATSLREEVEGAVQEGFALYGNYTTATLGEETILRVSDQLKVLGFKGTQIKKAVTFLSEPSQLLGKLLSSSPFEAATEYLLLSTPECDLPTRFLPAINSSNPIVLSAHSGTSDVKKRWIEERAVKEAGFPNYAVQELTTDSLVINDWPMLVAKLGNKLLGISDDNVGSDAPVFVLDEDELESLGGEIRENGHFVLPSFTAPITLHILFNAAECYPRPRYCPIYTTSETVPPYMRLHILSRVLSVLNDISDPGRLEHSFGLTLMQIMDEEWARLEDQGPPEVYDVLGHMMPEARKQRCILPSTPIEEAKTSGRTNFTNRSQRNVSRISSKIVPPAIADSRKQLPAYKSRADFLHALSKNRIIVVVGETGSGKTTQLPQYILESFEEASQGQDPYIIVTQPRRISAISVSARVSDERGHDGTVGYAVRGKSNQGNSTRLLFCTTGVVLRRLSNGDRLQNVTHVIVDEVHERSLDGDFLLLALKQLLSTHPLLKIVLMSASINHEVFSRYFYGAPVLSIPGITHPVTDRYLEDIIPTIGYVPTSLEQKKQADESQLSRLEKLRQQYGDLDDQTLVAIHSIASSRIIDYQLIASLVVYITKKHNKAGILIFLPGANEIRHCLDILAAHLDAALVDVFPLHANLPIEEQKLVFNKTEKWKVIASTNVAETSVTIDDIIYVIDSGKVKETRYSPSKDLTSLEETLVTKAASIQRRGRAEKAVMEEYPKAEILRVPLERVLLSAKLMNESEDARILLGKVIEPPDSATVDRAQSNLQELGAIDVLNNLTPLGRHIAMLPLDVRLAKMLILGTVFHCLSPALSVVALLSSKPLFTSPEKMRNEATRARKKFAVDNSDLLTDLEAFNQCQKLRGQGKFKLFCKENFISTTMLQEISTLRREFCAALQECGFLPPQCDIMDPVMNMNSNNTNLLKAIILGGLWPRVAHVHLPKSAIKFDKIQAGTVKRDNSAKEFKMLDLKEGRVFIHPASVLFECANWKSPFLAYFHKYQSTKIFLRDATEVPVYALLLFGGPIFVDHVKGGLTIGDKEAFVKLKAWPRIGVLVNQLRQLLDLLLTNCIDDGSSLGETQNHPVILAMLNLLAHDGMTE